MTPDEIRQVVRITLDELDQHKDNYSLINKKVSNELSRFFNSKSHSDNMYHVLQKLIDDPYIDIIYAHYRDELSLEDVAGIMDKDVSTIKRNKKRLILKIYELLEL